jgi:hypothetical protein
MDQRTHQHDLLIVTTLGWVIPALQVLLSML